eukprot:gene2495-2733_t
MAMSIPYPKRASALSFLTTSNENHGSEPPFSPAVGTPSTANKNNLPSESTTPLGNSWNAIGDNALGHGEHGSSDSNDAALAGLHGANTLPQGLDSILHSASQSYLDTDDNIQTSSLIHNNPIERMASAPPEPTFAIWGHDNFGDQGIQVKPSLSASNVLSDSKWSLFRPSTTLNRPASTFDFANSSTLNLNPMTRPSSTPIYSSIEKSLFGSFLSSPAVPLDTLNGVQTQGSVGLSSNSSLAIFENNSDMGISSASNAMNSLSIEPGWPKPLRYGQVNGGVDMGDLLGDAGSSQLSLSSLYPFAPSAQSTYAAGTDSFLKIERTASAPALIETLDSYIFSNHGGSNLMTRSSSNLAGLGSSKSPPPHSLYGNNGLGQHGFVSSHSSRHHSPAPGPLMHPNGNPNATSQNNPNKLNLHSVDDRAIENVVASNCQQILLDAMYHSLKAVELANTLRARVGTEILALVREKWGGLLSLLERHSDRFLVERIPKNDRVSLVDYLTGSKDAIGTNESSVTTGGNSLIASSTVSATVPNIGEEASPTVATDHTVCSDEISSLQLNEHGTDDGAVASGVEGLDEDLSNASRCLHVGNVPQGYTEIQLMREFEKFGTLEGLKLISQKNNVRRFAFVTFKTVNQAITAKHCLSKIHPWKSAISFAHKDMAANLHSSYQMLGNSHGAPHVYGHGHGHVPGSSGGYAKIGSQSMIHHPHNHHKLNNNHRQVLGHHPQSHAHHQHHNFVGARTSSPTPFGAFVDSSVSIVASSPHLERNNGNGESDSNHLHHNNGDHGGLSSNHIGHVRTHGGVSQSIKDPAILQRLCDDTYVPTQPWPMDSHNDMLLIHAIQQQLLDFNGTTTISKLRGYLKHRIGVTDNIKSVPLKALLLAYPQYFLVDGNIVSLHKGTVGATATLSV